MDKYEILEEGFGLELVLMQNDLTNADVLRCLHLSGLIDIDDYWFEEMEGLNEDE